MTATKLYSIKFYNSNDHEEPWFSCKTKFDNFEQNIGFGEKTMWKTYKIRNIYRDINSLNATIPSNFDIVIEFKDIFSEKRIVGYSTANSHKLSVNLYDPSLFEGECMPTDQELALWMRDGGRKIINKIPEYQDIKISGNGHMIFIRMRKVNTGIFTRIDLNTGKYYPYIVESIDYGILHCLE